MQHPPSISDSVDEAITIAPKRWERVSLLVQPSNARYGHVHGFTGSSGCRQTARLCRVPQCGVKAYSGFDGQTTWSDTSPIVVSSFHCISTQRSSRAAWYPKGEVLQAGNLYEIPITASSTPGTGSPRERSALNLSILDPSTSWRPPHRLPIDNAGV